jgi:hypothetical protein
MKRLALLSPLALLALSTACTDTPTEPVAMPPGTPAGPTFAVGQVAGASYTTTNQDYDGGNQCRNGPGLVNCNLYLGKEYVWINGGPTNGQSALTDGVYFFIVGVPGGQNSHINDQAPVVNPDHNLSDDYDSYLNRRFVVSGHHITAYLPDGDAGTADHIFDSGKIRLFPYSNTTNPGGEYFVALCRIDDNPSYNAANKTYDAALYPVTPNNCKYDNFKVRTKEDAPQTPEIAVSKTANPYFERSHQWKVEKGVDKASLSLKLGESKEVMYTVKYANTGWTDAGWKVSGTITVKNTHANLAATVNAVMDSTDFGVVTSIECSATLPHTLAAGASMTCDYEQDLSAAGLSASSSQYMNTAYAFVKDPLSDTDLEFMGSAHFKFEMPNQELDKCIQVADTFAGSSVTGVVCLDTSPKTFTYKRKFEAPTGFDALDVCGTKKYPNTASYTTKDTGAKGKADAHVAVTVDCQGCTPGYWKNNTAAWANTGFATSHLIRSPFGQGHTFWPAYPNPTKTNPSATHGDHTLHEGLDFKGGSTLSGKGEILLRAGVAALLSASWSNGGKTFAYPLSASQVIDAVNQALASQDPSKITETAGKLDQLNNQVCPINAKGVWTSK